MSHRARIPGLVAVLGLLLAGCSGGLHSSAPPEQAYLLRAPPAAPPGSVPAVAGGLLRVARPLAVPGLTSDRIMAVRAGQRLDAYARSRWAGPLPEVVAALTVETLRASGRFASVEEDRSPIAADYVLRMTLRHFEAEYLSAGATEGAIAAAPPPTLRVTLDCLIERHRDGRVIASFVADASTVATANRLGSVVEGFEKSARAALAQAVEQTADAIASDAQKFASPVPSTNR
jgi:cholesterol transport system auxiliary component